MVCLLQVLEKIMTHHNQTGLDDHNMTTVHHSFDPLEKQVMVICAVAIGGEDCGLEG
jgi:hypothetical protein